MNFLDIKVNPNSLLFSQRERERERESRRSDGAMVLGKFSVPGRPTNLENSRARDIALAVGALGGCLNIFSLVYLFSFLSPSLGDCKID